MATELQDIRARERGQTSQLECSHTIIHARLSVYSSAHLGTHRPGVLAHVRIRSSRPWTLAHAAGTSLGATRARRGEALEQHPTHARATLTDSPTARRVGARGRGGIVPDRTRARRARHRQGTEPCTHAGRSRGTQAGRGQAPLSRVLAQGFSRHEGHSIATPLFLRYKK